MKLPLFETYLNNDHQIREFLTDFYEFSADYEIVDGVVNTRGDVTLIGKLTNLGAKFGTVGGYFHCFNNQLTSLEGTPRTVGGYFNCNRNKLTSLEGSPETVGGSFFCYDNQLTSLEGSPAMVGGSFYCEDNQLPANVSVPPGTKIVGKFYK
jgi:hypothetical protein